MQPQIPTYELYAVYMLTPSSTQVKSHGNYHHTRRKPVSKPLNIARSLGETSGDCSKERAQLSDLLSAWVVLDSNQDWLRASEQDAEKN